MYDNKKGIRNSQYKYKYKFKFKFTINFKRDLLYMRDCDVHTCVTFAHSNNKMRTIKGLRN